MTAERLDRFFMKYDDGYKVNKDVRDMVLFIGHPLRWEDWGNLDHSVRTGQTAFSKLRGKPIWDYLAEDPDFAAVFNNAMTAASGLTDEAALGHYDFTGFTGWQLAAIPKPIGDVFLCWQRSDRRK